MMVLSGMGIKNHGKKLYNIGTRGQCYKTKTPVIYCHFRLNYHGNFVTLNLPWNSSTLLQYDSKVPQYFDPRKIRVKIKVVNYSSKMP
jgi:hypothetical protein